MAGCHPPGKLLSVFPMGRSMPQLEFRWTSWFRVLKAPAPPQTRPVREDGGLTAWCAEAAALPRSARTRPQGPRFLEPPHADHRRPRLVAGPLRSNSIPKLRECEPEELWRTLKHELAHLVAYERCGRRHIDPHGPEWQTACADFGIPGEQPFHTLPFKRRRMKRNHAYICPNCFATIHRVKPIQRTVACYDCCRKFNDGAYHDRFRLIKKEAGPSIRPAR